MSVEIEEELEDVTVTQIGEDYLPGAAEIHMGYM